MEASQNSYDISKFVKLFVCGGMAGCCAKTTVAPLDRVKILLQAHNQLYEAQGVTRTLIGVLRSEGFPGLYRGNGAQMVRIFPYSAIQFFSHDQYSKALTSKFGQSHMTQLVSGSLAGVTALSATYPLDVVRSRLAFQRKDNITYNGIIDCLRKMPTESAIGTGSGGIGIRAFYVGFLPSLCGMIPYAGISFYAFGSLKRLALQHWPEWMAVSDGGGDDDLRLTTGARLIIGGLSGAIAQTVSYPFDSTRRTMQVAVMKAANANVPYVSSGMLTTLTKLYVNYGIVRGLYRGLTINYVRVIPMAAVSFTAFETFKQMLGVA